MEERAVGFIAPCTSTFVVAQVLPYDAAEDESHAVAV